MNEYDEHVVHTETTNAYDVETCVFSYDCMDSMKCCYCASTYPIVFDRSTAAFDEYS